MGFINHNKIIEIKEFPVIPFKAQIVTVFVLKSDIDNPCLCKLLCIFCSHSYESHLKRRFNLELKSLSNSCVCTPVA